MRISDWSSDVCSSDLEHVALEHIGIAAKAGDAFLDSRAAGIVEADHGRAHLHRHVHDLADLLGVALRKRTAEDGEILAEDEDQSAVDRARPGHHPVAGYLRPFHRSEERRVGKAGVSPCRSRWSP